MQSNKIVKFLIQYSKKKFNIPKKNRCQIIKGVSFFYPNLIHVLYNL